MHRLTICCALSLALTACSADDGDEQAFDDGLKVDTTLLRLSAPAEDPASGDDRILMVGLEGAAPAGARFEVRPEGVDEILATGLVRDDGSFAVWVEHTEARPVVRLSTDRAEGPDTPINRSAAELRALAASLTFAQGDNTGGTVRGVVGAAVASSRVVVAQPGGGVSTATASDRGEFSLHTTARSGDTVAVFALDETLEKTSPAQVLEVTTDGFAVVISGARGTPTGAIAFAPADSLPADTPVSITRGATSVPVGFASVFGDGGFGACFAEASVNDVLSFSAEVEGSTRLADFEVPGNQGLVPLLNPTIVGTVDGDEVGLKGNAPGAVGYVVSINCDNGSRAIATVGGDGTFELSQLGVEGQVLGVVGIGVGGELGIAQFVFAGTAEEVPLPLPAPHVDLIGVSADTDSEVLVVGDSDATSGAVLPGLQVDVSVPPAAPAVVRAGADGEFAAIVPIPQTQVAVEIRQRAGPFVSAPALIEVPPADDAPSIPDGLISVWTADDALVVEVLDTGLEGGLVVANLDVPAVSFDPPTPLTPDPVQVPIAGEPGNRIAVMIVGEDGAPSRLALRTARKVDVPYFVSGPGAPGCIAGLHHAELDMLGVHDGNPFTITIEGDAFAGALVDGWTEGDVGVNLDGGATDRAIPPAAAVDVGGLEIVRTPLGALVNSGDSLVDDRHLLVFSMADGDAWLLQPPSLPPWSMDLERDPEDLVRVFAVDPKTGQATGCVSLEPIIDVSGPPGIDAVTPHPLVVGQGYKVVGSNLEGAVVSIGGWPQPVATNDGTTVTGTVNEGTPTGVQALKMLTLGGEATFEVTVVAAPDIVTVHPDPVVAGAEATISGEHLVGAFVTLGGTVATVLEADPSTLVFEAPVLPSGTYALQVANDYGQDSLDVEVTCSEPTLTSVPETGFIGEEVTLFGTGLVTPQVTIAGVAQIVIGATGSQLQIEIAKGTPFGVQPLVVTTPCGTVEDTISVVTDAPIVDEIVPVVAVLGQVLNIYGDHLEGASVTLGGMAQVLTVDSKKGLSFVVHPTTPTGAQTLEVATLGGIATKTVTVVGQPVITLVEPNPITAGNTLNIHGNHLIGAEVTIGGVDAIGVFAANTLVEAITSPDTPAGVQTVVLTTAAGEATAEVTVISPPKIDELSPDPAHPGQLLTITGANFVVPSVTIASIPHELFDITETQLKVVVLASVPLGNQPVTVTSNGGNATAFVKITIPPNIDSVLPDPLVIDEPFTISGDHLGPNPVVRIGGVVQLVTESSDTEITGKVLNSTPDGEHLLTVTTLDGEGIAGVVVIGPPNITGVDPDPVKVGETLTIFGTAMANATVSLGGTILEPITADDTTITVTVPADTPPGNQTIVVQTGAGLDTVQVTVLGLPPTISLVLPDPVLSGGTLTISGNNLLGATATLGGVGLTIIDNAIDSITAHVSPQTPTGLQPLAVTTSAGLAQTTVTVEDPPPTLPPVITFVAPSLAEVGAEVTITGQHLTGAIVVIAATEQTITSNTPTEIVFTVTDGTAVGDQTLTVFTVAGQAAVSFEVKGEPPVIGSALPDPVAIGQPLTITGAHLDSFTNATLGGVKQALFLTIQPTKLVFLVAPGTPTGASIALVITTPAGQASTLVGVDPAPFAAPEIFTVSPPSADPGADIEVFGDGLDGALWTIAGLPHTPEAGSNDFSVTLTISTDVPPGTQTVQAAEDGFVSTGTVFVNPQAPVDGQVFLSAVDATGGATLIGTNGTVEPLAGLDLTVDGTPVFATANGEGGFGVALTGVSGGQTVSLGQLIEGVASPAITRVLSGGDGPPTPHPFLIRVESAGDDAIVSGPPPAFGDPDNTVLAMAGAQVGFATAGDLYGAATITLTNGALDGPVTVFVGGPTPAAPASATTVTFATPFDPPLLASAVKDDEACLCGLKGTTDGEGLSVTIEDSGGDEIVPDELTWATGPDGAFAAWALLPKSAPNPPYVWRPDLGDAIPTVTFDAPAQELLSIEDVGLEPGDEGLTVTAAGLNEGVLFVVMSSDGQAAAQYADPTGAATVVLDGFPAVVRTFTVDLTTSNPTPCLTLDLLLE